MTCGKSVVSDEPPSLGWHLRFSSSAHSLCLDFKSQNVKGSVNKFGRSEILWNRFDSDPRLLMLRKFADAVGVPVVDLVDAKS